MTGAFHDFPKAEEFFSGNSTIIVHINRVEEFFSGDFAECTLPVTKSFFFVNFIRSIYVKDAEDFLDSSYALWWKFL